MRIPLLAWASLTILAVAVLAGKGGGAAPQELGGRRAPEFTAKRPGDWINSAPLKMEDLRGSVLLLYVWTFECWNCTRSLPWIRELEKQYGGKGLTLVGVHTPEFERERDAGNVRRAVQRYQLAFPQMLDNDFRYWRALDNQYWPAFYLVDKTGLIRHRAIGETHSGLARAREMEKAIETLLAEQVQSRPREHTRPDSRFEVNSKDERLPAPH